MDAGIKAENVHTNLGLTDDLPGQQLNNTR